MSARTDDDDGDDDGSRGPLDDLHRWITALQAPQMDAAAYHSGDSGRDQLITRAHVINEHEAENPPHLLERDFPSDLTVAHQKMD